MRTVAIGLLVLTACAAMRPGASSKDDVRGPWRELSSEHFVVWTNTSPARAQKLMRAMENLRQVVLGVSFFKKEIPGKSFVIAFHELSEVKEYVPEQFTARAWSGGNVLLQPMIVLAAASLDDDPRIVTHELTHVISFNVIANQPAWFREGMAGYFETVRLDEKHGTIEVGAPLEWRMQQIHDNGLTPISALFACNETACQDDRFYATTWALTTYLLNEHPTEMMQYMARLIDTPEQAQPQLWATVFPGLPPSKLDHELASWLRYGRHTVMKYNVELREWPVTERPISEADVLAAKGVLRYLDTPTMVATETTRSLALDPTNVIANMVNAVTLKSIPIESARAITAAHADDWRAWWITWYGTQSSPERREAKLKTCELLAQSGLLTSVPECAAQPADDKPAGEDPRYPVFAAATPKMGECFKKAKPAELAAMFTFDIDIADSGAVISARVTMASADVNACVETVLRGLTFPPHHAGTYHLSSDRTKH